MSQHLSSPTPLDVLDNWRLVHDIDDDRALAKLGDDAFDDFADRLNDHAAAWQPPEREPNEIRFTLDVGGFWGSLLLPATAVTFTDSDIDSADAENASGGVLSHLRGRYGTAFLYADRVVDVDPLVMVSRVHRDMRVYVMSVLINLYEAIRPAVEAGILIMAPDLSRDEMASVDDASMADEKPFADYFAARRGHRRSFEWIFLREVRRAAQVASRTSASVLAQYPWVWEYVAYIGGAVAEPHDIAVATALLHAELPVAAGIPAKTLVAIHQEEEAFVEWRNALRTTARLIRSTPAERSFAEEAAAVYQEALVPRIEAVRKSVSRSAALRGALLDEPARAAFGALFTAGSAAAAGLPIKGVVLSAGVGAASKVAYAGLRPPRPTGSDMIISMLPPE